MVFLRNPGSAKKLFRGGQKNEWNLTNFGTRAKRVFGKFRKNRTSSKLSNRLPSLLFLKRGEEGLFNKRTFSNFLVNRDGNSEKSQKNT